MEREQQEYDANFGEEEYEEEEYVAEDDEVYEDDSAEYEKEGGDDYEQEGEEDEESGVDEQFDDEPSEARDQESEQYGDDSAAVEGESQNEEPVEVGAVEEEGEDSTAEKPFMESETMDRGDGPEEQAPGPSAASMKILSGATEMKVRQTRRGWCQELLCCDHKSEFVYFLNNKKVAESTEEYTFCCRLCLGPHHPWDMTVVQTAAESEIVDIERPLKCPMAPCKCCCYQGAIVSSGDEDLGEIRETWWWFVPQVKVYDDDDDTVFIVHPKTCLGGMCIDCCSDGFCFPHCCHLIPWRVYPADAIDTNGDSPHVGKFAKVRKGSWREVFHEDQDFIIEFPNDATNEQKGLLMGSSLLLNSLWFEGSE